MSGGKVSQNPRRLSRCGAGIKRFSYAWPIAEAESDHEGRFRIDALPDISDLRAMAFSSESSSLRVPVPDSGEILLKFD